MIQDGRDALRVTWRRDVLQWRASKTLIQGMAARPSARIF
jgi:hypothetical protein